jgi:hypothetical protein
MQCNLGRWCFHTYWFRSVCREQKIGGEHAHVGQVKSCAHMEKNLALHLFLHPLSVSPPLSFLKFGIFWCSHMLCSQSSLAHDRVFSRVYMEMADWLRVAICLLLLMLCFTLHLSWHWGSFPYRQSSLIFPSHNISLRVLQWCFVADQVQTLGMKTI